MPAPIPDLDTKPFWDGCLERRFLVPTCADCKAPRWPPGPLCPVCRCERTVWVDASGRGTVYSWVVVTHPVHPVIADQVPYVVAVIELAEGVRVVGNVAGCSPDDVTPDMPVELYFEDVADGFVRPNFRAAGHERRGSS
jgi:uncharacterized OB-fold protein